MTRTLNEIDITSLTGVGKALKEKLKKIGVVSLQDMLFHLPLHYQDRTRVTVIRELKMERAAVVQGSIVSSQIDMGRRRSLACMLNDGTGNICLRFYHFNSMQKNQLQPGAMVRCFGEPRLGTTGLEFYHPEYTLIRDAYAAPEETALTPVYPATEGLSQYRLRKICEQALACLDHPQALTDWLPVPLQQSLRLWPLVESIHYLHRPPPEADIDQLEAGRHPSQRRLCFEELLAHHLSLQQQRKKIRVHEAPLLKKKHALTTPFLETLDFEMTRAQKRVINEISCDLAKPVPMLRLVQGDVGSGKTVVAAMAALIAMENGFQAILMAPTEILSEQHYKNFRKWLEPLHLETAMLTGKMKKGKKREALLADIKSGRVHMIIGTHALFQDDIEFHSPGLVIIDEQHRFGVHQRMALWNKGRKNSRSGPALPASHQVPHQLIMTATPIPRTLAMSAYADLDCSVIDELPPGRTPVNTVVINDHQRQDIIDRVSSACTSGRQAYWVCTLIEESEALQCQAAEVTAAQLHEALPELNIGLVHGRMKPDEKNEVMEQFKQGRIHLLVATTVIEVGVDVPNASLMIIENPERLGLSQLHQLRGRVGRGSVASHCVLMYHAPLSGHAYQRLKIMRESSDGFVIAEKDLALRGPGEVLGTKQTGDVQFRLADLQRDKPLLPSVHQAAKYIQTHAPDAISPLIRRWLPDGEQYLNV